MFVHRSEIRQTARELTAAGLEDGEVARRLGIPRATVRDWRRGRQAARHACHRCWRPTRPVAFTAADYAELLGLYLGDGHISVLPRTQRLRLMLDGKYPQVVAEAGALIARMLPRNRLGQQSLYDGRMITLHAYYGHWTCLFPQHGAGKKHLRRVVLEPWQEEAVASAPWAFLRGCIRSDGCVYVNRTAKYEYESYDFANLSADIRELFRATCAQVGVECRVYDTAVRVYRRASVALMLDHVGRKS